MFVSRKQEEDDDDEENIVIICFSISALYLSLSFIIYVILNLVKSIFMNFKIILSVRFYWYWNAFKKYYENNEIYDQIDGFFFLHWSFQEKKLFQQSTFILLILEKSVCLPAHSLQEIFYSENGESMSQAQINQNCKILHNKKLPWGKQERWIREILQLSRITKDRQMNNLYLNPADKIVCCLYLDLTCWCLSFCYKRLSYWKE